MPYHENVLSAIGRTPLVKLAKVADPGGATILAKLEYLNPGGSIKDRMAVHIVEKAERAGLLKKGGTIVENTSGNTGVGLAIAAVGLVVLGWAKVGSPALVFLGILLFAVGEMITSPRIQEYITWIAPKEKAGLYMGSNFLAVAIGGVMGGGNTEVTAATTRVLLESAYFNPGCVRRTSRALGLHTDAAYRFERGADFAATTVACARVAQIILESGGGTLEGDAIDAVARAPSRPSTKTSTRPPSSARITPYFSATSSGSRTIAAIVAMAPLRWCASSIGARSKSMIESVGNTSAGCSMSQYSIIRIAESALPLDSASYLTGEYLTSTPKPSPYPIMTLIW